MRFFIFTTVAASVAVAVAVPALDNRQARLCSSPLYSQAQCCVADVLGILDLNCANPSVGPTDVPDFKRICGYSGKQANCCVLPIAGQDVLCIGL